MLRRRAGPPDLDRSMHPIGASGAQGCRSSAEYTHFAYCDLIINMLKLSPRTQCENTNAVDLLPHQFCRDMRAGCMAQKSSLTSRCRVNGAGRKALESCPVARAETRLSDGAVHGLGNASAWRSAEHEASEWEVFCLSRALYGQRSMPLRRDPEMGRHCPPQAWVVGTKGRTQSSSFVPRLYRAERKRTDDQQKNLAGLGPQNARDVRRASHPV